MIVVIVASMLLATVAWAQPQPRVVVPQPGAPYPYQAAPSYCWLDVRMYQTLRHGPVDFCRQKLKYTPGKLECYQITDQVCAVLLPNGQWTDTRSAVVRQVFACPRGPEPPVCRRMDLS